MARTRVMAPAYVQTLQGNYGPVSGSYSSPNGTGGGYSQVTGSLDQGQQYRSAAQQYYSNGGVMLGQQTYSPQDAATYAQAQQQAYQGGTPVSTRDLGQAAADQAQRQNLQAVGAQRGAGGQSGGLRAAMMGTTNAATAQTQAGMQAQQEQVAQRQAILQQQMAQDRQQAEASQAMKDERARFEKEREENDADTQSGMANMVGTFSGLSDERAKDVKGGKRRKAPKLVIMLGGGKY